VDDLVGALDLVRPEVGGLDEGGVELGGDPLGVRPGEPRLGRLGDDDLHASSVGSKWRPEDRAVAPEAVSRADRKSLV